MLNFLLDIAPDKSQLLLTIKLAGILREKKQEVYYTYTSNPAFTPVLYDKGISNCVLYPDDFRWLKPDLTLLDCRYAAHASLYRQLAIDYIFIAMQLPDQKNIQDKDISILYLPPTPYLSSGSGPRLETLTKRLQLSLIHISEPTRQAEISYAVFCLKKKKKKKRKEKKH